MIFDNVKGFTLLEILIAMSMLVVLLSVLFATLTGSLGVMEKVSADTEIYHMARVALHRIAGDVESSFLIPGRTGECGVFEKESGAFVARGGFFNGRAGFYLRFPTKAKVVPDGSSGRCWESEVTYELRRKDHGDSLMLIRTEVPPGDEIPGRGGNGRHVLCEGLAGLGFNYHSGDEIRDDWNSSDGDTSGGIPDRVTVVLVFENPSRGKGNMVFMTQVAIPSMRNRYDRPAG